ncbi:MAG: alanine aminotransferase, partial [Candidatus Hecatellales archaeon]
MFKVARRISEVEYAIRDIIVPASRLEAEGVRLIKLNIGDPSKFDFDVPEHVKEALRGAIAEGYNSYAPSEGDMELREAIAERERRKGAYVDASDVIITQGVSESIQMLFGSMLEEGDEVLVPGPGYPPYTSLAKFFGAKPVPYRTVEEEGWQPDLEDLQAKITDKTRMIILINPNNPTGAVYS